MKARLQFQHLLQVSAALTRGTRGRARSPPRPATVPGSPPAGREGRPGVEGRGGQKNKIIRDSGAGMLARPRLRITGEAMRKKRKAAGGRGCARVGLGSWPVGRGCRWRTRAVALAQRRISSTEGKPNPIGVSRCDRSVTSRSPSRLPWPLVTPAPLVRDQRPQSTTLRRCTLETGSRD